MMRVKFGLFIFLMLLASCLVIGCKKDADQQTETKTQEEPDKTAETVEPEDPNDVSDAEITASVKSKLLMDENVAARRIDVNTDNGVVTLRGTVATPTEADRAVELAKTADGVRLVHSYLKTDAETSDAGEKTEDQVAAVGEKAQDAVNEAGEVIETGVEQAQEVGGDAAITAQIKWKLAKDKLVQAADIDVDTKDRRVILTGIVSSQQEAQRALQIAQSVEDVLAVDSNLRVR